jgi:2-(1,2-epoxy-1,2-dihydrophenyl)acetyl-CoA isomerase
MMKDLGHINLNISEGVATIEFDRPELLNASSAQLLRETFEALYSVEYMDDVGAVVVTGKGKGFNSGFDLKEIPADEGKSAIHEHFRLKALYWHTMIHALARIKKPVLAAVNGKAAGGGVGILMACDMAVSVNTATFVPAWMSIGIANDTGSSYSMSRIIGFRRAMEWLLTNRTINAQEALDWGLVNRIYAEDEFQGAVNMIAKDLANAPTHLQAMAKERVHSGWYQPLEECTEYEIQNVLSSVNHPHFIEQLEGFIKKTNKSNTEMVRMPE